MDSQVFEKCDLNKEFLQISHTPLPISQNTPKTQNTKSTVGGPYATNNDNSHNLLILYTNQIEYLLSGIYIFYGKKYAKEKLS